MNNKVTVVQQNDFDDQKVATYVTKHREHPKLHRTVVQVNI